MNTTELLENAVSAGASDIFVVAGRHLCIELCGKISMCFRESHYALPDGNQCTWIYDRYRRKCFCIKNPW